MSKLSADVIKSVRDIGRLKTDKLSVTRDKVPENPPNWKIRSLKRVIYYHNKFSEIPFTRSFDLPRPMKDEPAEVSLHIKYSGWNWDGHRAKVTFFWDTKNSREAVFDKLDYGFSGTGDIQVLEDRYLLLDETRNKLTIEITSFRSYVWIWLEVKM